MRFAIPFIALLTVLASHRTEATRQHETARWEYLIAQPAGNKTGLGDLRKQEQQLDSLGREGWELVAVPTAQLMGTAGGSWFYFKRPAQKGE